MAISSQLEEDKFTIFDLPSAYNNIMDKKVDPISNEQNLQKYEDNCKNCSTANCDLTKDKRASKCPMDLGSESSSLNHSIEIALKSKKKKGVKLKYLLDDSTTLDTLFHKSITVNIFIFIFIMLTFAILRIYLIGLVIKLNLMLLDNNL